MVQRFSVTVSDPLKPHGSPALNCARDTKLCSTKLKRFTHKFVICGSCNKGSKRHGVISPLLRRAFASQTECIYHTAIEQREGRGVSNSDDTDVYEDGLHGPQRNGLDSPAAPMVFQDLCLRQVEVEIPWALSIHNHAGAIDGWLEGYRVANSSVGGFRKADPLSSCNSTVTGFLRRIGRDPIATSNPLF